jgi:hypothetical protein
MMKENVAKKNLVAVLHVVVCLAFIAIPFLDAPTGRNGGIEYHMVTRDVLRYAFILVFFYLNYLYFIPRFYFRKRFITFTSFIILCFLIIAYLPDFIAPITPFAPPPDVDKFSPHSPPPFLKPAFIGRHLIHSFLSFAIAFFVSFLLKINVAFSRAKEEKKDLEFTYLKAQINPHFLFNTLNAIYALAVKKSDKTPEAVQELAGMMRYIMHDASRDRILLEKEIAYLDNYIQLQKHRYSYTLDIHYQKTGELYDQVITPLVLIPFVENAFKHGVSPEEHSQIIIELHIDKNHFSFFVSNSKVSQHTVSMEPSGIGIHNTKARLHYAYPGKHQLKIDEDVKKYSVTLILEL